MPSRFIAATVRQAAAADGPSYIQILVPCVPGWKIEPEKLSGWNGAVLLTSEGDT
jgi:pyruvate/2-oxoacid:ferredoxin oxidoreductase beta subunit